MTEKKSSPISFGAFLDALRGGSKETKVSDVTTQTTPTTQQAKGEAQTVKVDRKEAGTPEMTAISVADDAKYQVLCTLLKHDKLVPYSDLPSMAGISPKAMFPVVDELSSYGFVVVQTDPDTSSTVGSVVSITPSGLKFIEAD